MEKVRLLKDHCEYRKGEVLEVDKLRARYWQATGVASDVAQEKEEKVVYDTKEDKTVRGRKTKNG